MHYQETNTLNTENVIEKLLRFCPHFAKNIDLEDIKGEGPYYILRFFATYVLEGTRSRNLASSELAEAFRFLNCMGKSSDTDMQTLLVVGIFEHLTNFDDPAEDIQIHLQGKAKQLFQELVSEDQKRHQALYE